MKLYYSLLRLFWNRVEQHNKLRRSSAYKSDSTVLINDIPYFDGGAEHLLDIHLPKDGESAPLPVIVSVHGGGWMYGMKENNSAFCARLAECGFAVFNLNYTLAPKASLGDMLCDINRALSFIGNNADKYRADTGRLFLMGDSAGAQLALFASAIANSERMRDIFHAEAVPFSVKALFLISPVCFQGKGPGPVSANHRIALTAQFMKEHRAHINPDFLFENGAVCPAFLTTSAGDRLGRRQTMRLAGLFEKYKIKHTFDYAPEPKLEHIYPVHRAGSAESDGIIAKMTGFIGDL